MVHAAVGTVVLGLAVTETIAARKAVRPTRAFVVAAAGAIGIAEAFAERAVGRPALVVARAVGVAHVVAVRAVSILVVARVRAVSRVAVFAEVALRVGVVDMR